MLPTTLTQLSTRTQELDNLYVSLKIAQSGSEPAPVTLADALKRSNYNVILGDPGAGKTTMLKFLTLTFARACRNGSSTKSDADRLHELGKVKRARSWVQSESGCEGYPIPIFVALSTLRDIADWPTQQTLFSTIRASWAASDIFGYFPSTFLDAHLKRGECIFLLDGFDELPDANSREAAAEQIGKLATSAPGNKIIVTSRQVGYRSQLSRFGVEVLQVEPLSPSLIRTLVTNWYVSLHRDSSSRSSSAVALKQANDLLDIILTNRGVADLAVNPMLLSLIVLVQYTHGVIPDHRHVLYEECIKILLERRFAPNSLRRVYEDVLPSNEATAILKELAYELQVKELRNVPQDVLEDELLRPILQKLRISKAIELSPAAIIDNIEQRSQLIASRGWNLSGKAMIAYSHRTFQEYFCATAFKDSMHVAGTHLVCQRVLDFYERNPEWWEEVALLFAAQLSIAERPMFLVPLEERRKSYGANS